MSDEENAPQPRSGLCGLWDRMGLTIQTLLGVLLGVVLGLMLRAFTSITPDSDAVAFIYYPGELFLNALKLLVVPMIATGMILAVLNLGDLDKIKYIGSRAVLYYLSTTFIAAAEGLIWVNIIRPGSPDDFSKDNATAIDTSNFAKKKTSDAFLDVGRSMLPDNIVVAFTENNILGIIVFCLLFGYYVSKVPGENKQTVLNFFEASNEALMGIINTIIAWTPLGICSLVMKEMLSNADLQRILLLLGMYVVTVLVGILIHALVVYPTIYFLVTRQNPFRVYRGISQAILTAFATSSSAATLPVTTRCVEAMGVEEEISRFVLPLGATVNMDGTAIYFPIAVIFLANCQNIALTFGQQLSIAFVSSFVSIGAAPIPNAGLVYLILIMRAVDIPIEGISFVLAIDWFVDRVQTAANITGDSFGSMMFQYLRSKRKGEGLIESGESSSME